MNVNPLTQRHPTERDRKNQTRLNTGGDAKGAQPSAPIERSTHGATDPIWDKPKAGTSTLELERTIQHCIVILHVFGLKIRLTVGVSHTHSLPLGLSLTDLVVTVWRDPPPRAACSSYCVHFIFVVR